MDSEWEWEAAWDGPRIEPRTLTMPHGVYVTRWWTDIDGRRWTLDEMTPSHRASALRFIRKRAWHIADSTWWALVGEVPLEGRLVPLADEECRRITQLGPEAWLETTPLVQTLAALVARDEADADRRDRRTVQPRRRRTWGQVAHRA